jgi:hypothetical protein
MLARREGGMRRIGEPLAQNNELLETGILRSDRERHRTVKHVWVRWGKIESALGAAHDLCELSRIVVIRYDDLGASLRKSCATTVGATDQHAHRQAVREKLDSDSAADLTGGSSDENAWLDHGGSSGDENTLRAVEARVYRR